MAITGGDGQTDTVAKVLRLPLEVQVTRLPPEATSASVPSPMEASWQSGDPVRNRIVSFRVVEGPVCGRPLSSVAMTDANGKARKSWELGTVARSCRMEVSTASGLPDDPILRDTFHVRAVAGAPAQIERTIAPATALTGVAIEVAVRVTDAHGNAVEGAGITWTPATGSGNIVPITERTDGFGISRARWHLPTIPGERSMTASAAPGVVTTFTVLTVSGTVVR